MVSPAQATARARALRKDAPDAENRLWYVLRNRNIGGYKFVRQFAIDPYTADFACREAALIIELDGGQHATSDTDAARTAYLNREGYSVLRFWNNDVLENRAGVLEAILGVLQGTPSPGLRFAPADLSPTGRGNRGTRAASASAARYPASGDDTPFLSPSGRGRRAAPGEGAP